MTHITSHRVTGTLRWQAPELFPNMQIQEPDDIERRNTMASDVYAYGMVCHEVHNSYIFFFMEKLLN
jgi:serine/threonine protein kinase